MLHQGLTTGNCSVSLVDACNDFRPQANVNTLSAQILGLNAANCTVAPASSTFENLLPYSEHHRHDIP